MVPTEVYLSPRHGFGYALGIIGGLMMLASVIYQLRKRVPSLAVIGSVKLWFRLHMVLGIVGPLAILYHSNFSLGATNSNVALVCMLMVSGSGLVGRYFYARIHQSLYGRLVTLRELADEAEKLRQHSGSLKMLPGLMREVELAEKHIAAPAMLVIRPLLAALRQRSEKRRLTRLVRNAVAMAATRCRVLRKEYPRFTMAADGYIAARLMAVRRVAEFEASERLFAAWHVLHMPLFFMLIIVSVVHVIAVHVY
ncbi:MAG: pyridine nucleotide-disulfide oxidoreductase [Gammaproteobacteria bacterium]|nr:pyridine nucleotide-disulfide oxidoreductase [Gammaproteobacteria bacterium]